MDPVLDFDIANPVFWQHTAVMPMGPRFDRLIATTHLYETYYLCIRLKLRTGRFVAFKFTTDEVMEFIKCFRSIFDGRARALKDAQLFWKMKNEYSISNRREVTSLSFYHSDIVFNIGDYVVRPAIHRGNLWDIVIAQLRPGEEKITYMRLALSTAEELLEGFKTSATIMGARVPSHEMRQLGIEDVSDDDE